jgi:hypothetical protein
MLAFVPYQWSQFSAELAMIATTIPRCRKHWVSSACLDGLNRAKCSPRVLCRRNTSTPDPQMWSDRRLGGPRAAVPAAPGRRQQDTKKAREDLRIATSKIENHVERLTGHKRSESRPDDSRIFPLCFAPVVVNEGNQRVIRPMRYTCRLAGKPAFYDRKVPGTYISGVSRERRYCPRMAARVRWQRPHRQGSG